MYIRIGTLTLVSLLSLGCNRSKTEPSDPPHKAEPVTAEATKGHKRLIYQRKQLGAELMITIDIYLGVVKAIVIEGTGDNTKEGTTSMSPAKFNEIFDAFDASGTLAATQPTSSPGESETDHVVIRVDADKLALYEFPLDGANEAFKAWLEVLMESTVARIHEAESGPRE